MNLHILLLLGLWMSNEFTGLHAIQHQNTSNDSVVVDAGAAEAPVIIPQQQRIELKATSLVTVYCTDKEPIAWKYPEGSKAMEMTYRLNNEPHLHGKQLTLWNAGSNTTGNYYCIRTKDLTKNISLMEEMELVDLVNNRKASTVYVHAEDLPQTTNVTENVAEVPVIIPQQKRIELKAAISVTLYCMDTDPIAWKFPDGSKAIEMSYLPKEKVRHGKQLQLWNTDNYTTGNYYCIRTTNLTTNISLMEDTELVDLVNQNKASTIYIFVDENTEPDYTSYNTNLSNENFTKAAAAVEAPLIIPQLKKIELKINSEITLNCTDTEPIEWKYPKEAEAIAKSYLPRTKQQLYGQLLVLSHANSKTTGNYYCVRTKALTKDISLLEDSELTDLVNKKMAATINVFVNDTRPVVIVYLAPTDRIHSDSQHYAAIGGTFDLECLFRKPNSGKYLIKWILPTGVQWDETRMVETNRSHDSYKDYTQFHSNLSIVKAEADDSGIYTCNISDELSDDSSSNNNTYEMWIVREKNNYIEIGERDNAYEINERYNKTIDLTVRYGGYPWPILKWYNPNGIEIFNNGKYEIINENVTTSTLKIYNTHLSDTGIYVVEATNPFKSERRQFNLTIEDVPIVVVVDVSVDANNGTAHVQCKVQSLYKPVVKWIFESCSIEPKWPTCTGELIKDFHNTISSNGNTTMEFIYDLYFIPKSSGRIRCSAENNIGTTIGEGLVLIREINDNTTIFGISDHDIIALNDRVTSVNVVIASILLIFSVSIVMVLYLCVRVKRKRESLRELKAAGLENFENGALEHINPALTLNEQVDFLPYNRCFEFPREKLKLGQQLGAGAFGVLLKAQALDIMHTGKETIVAVKMVKRQSGNEVIKALVSELKIMTYLGKHLNVVNLLGAVTRNINKRELMVIVEYCSYGNIRDFLIHNQKQFINQINPSTDKIEPSLMNRQFSDILKFNRSINTYSDPSGYGAQSDESASRVNNGLYANEQILKAIISEDDPQNVASKIADSADYMAFTTTDLVSWAFQISFGMEFLSSKNVLHGDLAAKNILLCEDNIVKISDFGSSRSIYEKQGVAMPIKWLALESFTEGIFSTYTDVWSFGIVMWEIFSLGKVPYAELDNSLYMKLKDGYRMEKPTYANNEIYDIMLECWSTNPERPPLFNVLKEKFAVILGKEATTHIINLNEPFVKVNMEYMKSNQIYDKLMNSADNMAPQQPKYMRISPKFDGYFTASPNEYVTNLSPPYPKELTNKAPQENTEKSSHISSAFYSLAKKLSSRNKDESNEEQREEIPMLPRY